MDNPNAITVEPYDKEYHGHWDDCDWVVSYYKTAELGIQIEAENIAANLAISEVHKHENSFNVQLFCCHA